jgi:hypothetical protein
MDLADQAKVPLACQTFVAEVTAASSHAGLALISASWFLLSRYRRPSLFNGTGVSTIFDSRLAAFVYTRRMPAVWPPVDQRVNRSAGLYKLARIVRLPMANSYLPGKFA